MFPPHPPPLLSLDTVNLLGAPPLSPAETCSSTTSEFPPQTPPLQQQQSHHRPPVHVVCTAPLVAPRPLPYHSPTFIQFDLPDMDEDLSISPFPRNSGKKRQRDVYEDEENPDAVNGSGPPISQTCRSSLLSPPPHKKWQGDSSVPISHTIKPRRRMPRARFNSPYMTHLST
ncbi:hypothetical protein DL96DRAFT_1708643 [Flagelloscypha sp. PMI_526]|nr:hypothetical protein DL96DRAFT_1708643 [Flagelloscypha sp. PMI_526]